MATTTTTAGSPCTSTYPDVDDVVFSVDPDNFVVESNPEFVAHMAGHLLAARHIRLVDAHPDVSRSPMESTRPASVRGTAC